MSDPRRAANEAGEDIAEVATPGSGGSEASRTRKTRYRAAGCPKGVPVLRAALRDPRLCRTDAIVLALFVWLSQNEGEVSVTCVSSWLDCHRSTVSRSAKKLRALKFLDNDHQPLPRWKGHFQLPPKAKKPAAGFVYFDFESMRQVANGRKETIAFQAFQSFGDLKTVERDKKGRTEVKAELFAKVIGVKTPKTALKVLYQLGKMTLLRVHRTKGHAAMVELVPERERRPTPIVPRAHRKAKPTKSPKPRVGEPPAAAVEEQKPNDDARGASADAALAQALARIAEGNRLELERKAEQLAKKAVEERELRAQGSPPFFR